MAARLLIVDDESLARARLKAQIADLALGLVVGEAASGIEALQLAEALAPEIVLLDIRMPGMDGLETARHLSRLPSAPAVIFTTAFDEHALAAFDMHAIDYLLKPIRADRLQTAVIRAQVFSTAQLQALSGPVAPVRRTHFSALVKGALRFVPLEDVRYLYADQGYVTVVHRQGELLIEESLRALEQELAADFLRIHRHTLVAVAHVVEFKRNRLGNGTVALRDIAVPLSVSRRLLIAVRERLLESAKP
ncbi:MAG: response regulator transcription factor [Gammaproteobacteria bacterium]|nr:response regulator transcription factor [Gammaproteobacteria bacterium]